MKEKKDKTNMKIKFIVISIIVLLSLFLLYVGGYLSWVTYKFILCLFFLLFFLYLVWILLKYLFYHFKNKSDKKELIENKLTWISIFISFIFSILLTLGWYYISFWDTSILNINLDLIIIFVIIPLTSLFFLWNLGKYFFILDIEKKSKCKDKLFLTTIATSTTLFIYILLNITTEYLQDFLIQPSFQSINLKFLFLLIILLIPLIHSIWNIYKYIIYLFKNDIEKITRTKNKIFYMTITFYLVLMSFLILFSIDNFWIYFFFSNNFLLDLTIFFLIVFSNFFLIFYLFWNLIKYLFYHFKNKLEKKEKVENKIIFGSIFIIFISLFSLSTISGIVYYSLLHWAHFIIVFILLFLLWNLKKYFFTSDKDYKVEAKNKFFLTNSTVSIIFSTYIIVFFEKENLQFLFKNFNLEYLNITFVSLLILVTVFLLYLYWNLIKQFYYFFKDNTEDIIKTKSSIFFKTSVFVLFIFISLVLLFVFILPLLGVGSDFFEPFLLEYIPYIVISLPLFPILYLLVFLTKSIISFFKSHI